MRAAGLKRRGALAAGGRWAAARARAQLAHHLPVRPPAASSHQRASEAEARVSELDYKSHSLQSALDGVRGTLMTALRECHERDVNVKQRAEQLEEEVLRLTERLK